MVTNVLLGCWGWLLGFCEMLAKVLLEINVVSGVFGVVSNVILRWIRYSNLDVYYIYIKLYSCMYEQQRGQETFKIRKWYKNIESFPISNQRVDKVAGSICNLVIYCPLTTTSNGYRWTHQWPTRKRLGCGASDVILKAVRARTGGRLDGRRSTGRVQEEGGACVTVRPPKTSERERLM